MFRCALLAVRFLGLVLIAPVVGSIHLAPAGRRATPRTEQPRWWNVTQERLNPTEDSFEELTRYAGRLVRWRYDLDERGWLR